MYEIICPLLSSYSSEMRHSRLADIALHLGSNANETAQRSIIFSLRVDDVSLVLEHYMIDSVPYSDTVVDVFYLYGVSMRVLTGCVFLTSCTCIRYML